MKVEQSTGETPRALLNRKEANEHTIYYWNIFHVLSSSRRFTSAGLAGIPISEILAYAEYYDIDDLDDREDLLYVIQSLDTVYLDHSSKKTGAS